MRLALHVLLAGAALLAPVRSASAGSEDVEGRGFRARAPAGFRFTDSVDEGRNCARTYAKTLASGGELILTFTSRDFHNEKLALTEMALGRMVDSVPAPKPQVTPAQADGAEDAFEVLTLSEQHIVRSLMARQDSMFVTMSVTAPAGADDEVEEAWTLTRGSFRLVRPGTGVGTLVVWVLGGLVLLAVLVTLSKKRSREAAAPPRRAPVAPEHVPVAHTPVRAPFVSDSILPSVPSDSILPYVPEHHPLPNRAPAASSEPEAEAEPEVEPDAGPEPELKADPVPAASEPPTPVPAPETAPAPNFAAAPDGLPVPTRPGGGFSRAEDGLPVFTPEQKAAGIPTEGPRRRQDRPRPTPPPTKAKAPPPGPAPLNRPPSPRPPLPVVKSRT